MAKSKRMTRAEVMEILESINLDQDFEAAGFTSAELKSYVNGFKTKFEQNQNGEAGERAIVDEITRDLNGRLQDQMRGIFTAQANSRFEYEAARVQRDRTAAVVKLLNGTRDQYEDRFGAAYDENLEKRATAEGNITQANAEIGVIDRNIAGAQAKLAESLEPFKAELKTARERDIDAFYMDAYEADYIASLGIFGKVKYKLEGSKRAQKVREYAEAHGFSKGQFTDSMRGPAEEAVARKIAGFQEEQATAGTQIERATQAREGQTTIINENTAVVERLTRLINTYETFMNECQANIETMENYGTAVEGEAETLRLAAETPLVDIARGALTALEAAEGTHPLVLLAYEGFVARLEEQQRIQESIERDANPSWLRELFVGNFDEKVGIAVSEVIKRDITLNTDNYMELAFEHYMAANFTTNSSSITAMERVKKIARGYFKNYIPDIDARMNASIERLATISVATANFRDVSLRTAYVDHLEEVKDGKATELLADAVAKNMKLLDERVAGAHSRLKVIDADYDRLARFTTNPEVKQYMALTMIRESILRDQRAGKVLTEDQERELAAVSYELDQVIATTMKNGTYIDLAEASSIAVETLIPGYDQLREFAEMQGIDLSTALGKEFLASEGIQEEFERYQTTCAVNNLPTAQVEKYLEMQGIIFTPPVGYAIDTPEYAAAREEYLNKREAFLEKPENRTAIITTLTTPGKMYNHLLTEADQQAFAAGNVEAQRLVEIYAQHFTDSKLPMTIEFKGGKILLAAGGQNPTVISPADLQKPEFMSSIGLMAEVTQDQAQENASKIPSSTYEVSKIMDARAGFVCHSVKGQDLGILGQAALELNTEEDFVAARKYLLGMLTDSKRWEKYKARYLRGVDDPTTVDEQTIRISLLNDYSKAYNALLDRYAASKEKIKTLIKDPIEKGEDQVDEVTEEETEDDTLGEVLGETEVKEGKAQLNKDGSQKKARLATVNAKLAKISEAIEQFSQDGLDPDQKALLAQGVASAMAEALTYMSKYDLTEAIAAQNKEREAAEAVNSGAAPSMYVSTVKVPDPADDTKTIEIPAIVRDLGEGRTETFYAQDGKLHSEQKTQEAAQGDE